MRVTLARILRPRGRIGEVAAEILTDFPERLTSLRDVFLESPDGAVRPMRVRKCWLSSSRGGQAVFHFEGSDSINDAERLVGAEVQVALADRVPLPPGRYYVSDLVGCEVWEGAALLGSVRDVVLETGTPLLVVKTQPGELFVPLAEEICTKVDLAARRIEVCLPEGLRELNLPGESAEPGRT